MKHRPLTAPGRNLPVAAKFFLTAPSFNQPFTVDLFFCQLHSYLMLTL
jgi:hypothetical protein